MVGTGGVQGWEKVDGERTSTDNAVPERVARADSCLVVDYLWYAAVVGCAFDCSAEPRDVGRDLHSAVVKESARF